MNKSNWLVLTGIILFTVLSSQMRAQQNGQIKGTVIESASNDPLVDATVRLLLSDNTMKVAVATEEDGSFLFKDIPSGTYFLSVTYTGFEPVYQPVEITSYTQSVNIGTLAMEEDVVQLDEVVITANYPKSDGLSKLLVLYTGSFSELEKLTMELPAQLIPDVVENSYEPTTFPRTYRNRRFN